MGATLSVWNGQYKMIPVYLSVEIQNSKYKIQNDTNLTLCDSTKYKIKNHTNYHQFGNFSSRNFPSALSFERNFDLRSLKEIFGWYQWWLTWRVDGRTVGFDFKSFLWTGTRSVGGQILETGRYQVRSGFQLTPFQFRPHSFNWQFLFKVFTKILFLSSPSWRGQGREDGRAMLSGSQMVSSMISGNSHGLSSYLSDDIEFLPIVGSANSHSQFIFKKCSCIALGCFSLVFFSFCPPIKNSASAMSCY